MIRLASTRFPRDDTHFADHFRHHPGPYQWEARVTAISQCRALNLAVDVGAHVGLWTRELETKFAEVHAFEPVPANHTCLITNTRRSILHKVALSDGSAPAYLRQLKPGNSGTWSVSTDPASGSIQVECRTLDSYNLSHLDLLKVDVEHHELFVLCGAMTTILAYRPVICVELGQYPDPVIDLLHNTLGYVLHATFSADYIYLPKEHALR